LRQVLQYSAGGPAAPYLRVDPYLARGLSYYTGPIFEIEFPGLSGSGGGGGRYDDLIGMFSGQVIPACGFSLGLERILLLMEERGMFPERLAGQPQVLVTQYDDATANASFRLATELRAAGLRVDLYPGPGSLRQAVQVCRRAPYPVRGPGQPARSCGGRYRRQRSRHRRTGRGGCRGRSGLGDGAGE
jgi:histidyl-tRNA synthetase